MKADITRTRSRTCVADMVSAPHTTPPPVGTDPLTFSAETRIRADGGRPAAGRCEPIVRALLNAGPHPAISPAHISHRLGFPPFYHSATTTSSGSCTTFAAARSADRLRRRLRAGAAVDARNDAGRTPLHGAVYDGEIGELGRPRPGNRTGVMWRLLVAGADPAAQAAPAAAPCRGLPPSMPPTPSPSFPLLLLPCPPLSRPPDT